MRGVNSNASLQPAASRSVYPKGSVAAKPVEEKKAELLITKDASDIYSEITNIPDKAKAGAENAREYLKNAYNPSNKMTSFLFSDWNGQWTKSPTFFTCYGGLRYNNSGVPERWQYNHKNPIPFFITKFYRDLGEMFEHHPESENMFLEWIFNESMFAPAFVTKNAKEAKEEGVICNTHFPCSIVVQACTFARGITHMARVPKLWDIMVQAGIDPHLALLCAHQFSPTIKNDYDELVPIMIDGGNSVFNSLRWFEDEGFKRFVNQDRTKWHGEPMYKAPGGYGWFLTQWQKNSIAAHSPEATPFVIMQDYDYTEGTAIPLSDCLDQCKMLQQKYIG